METVYVTKSKIESLIKMFNLRDNNNYKELIFHDVLYGILATPELGALHAFKEILNGMHNIESLPKYKKGGLKKYGNKNNRFVYLGSKPAYHKNIDCEHLSSDYQNYEIPVQIPDYKTEEYRKFFIKNKKLYDKDFVAFCGIAGAKFKVKIENINEISQQNSGLKNFENITVMSLEEIMNEIKTHLLVMETYRNKDEKHEKLIEKYGYGTHAAKENGESKLFIEDPNSIIYKWHEYKIRLKYLIKQYYISDLNPDFRFDENVLNQCGFVPCKTCHNKH